jgi:tetraacyldisaccharide 4'-kinase
VGNLTAGGTGKTPFVAYLANSFCTHQRQPAILSRGYGSQDGEANDEKRVLDLLCPNVPHEQHPDRVAAAARVCEQHNIDVLILDDGFQHRRASRDLDIVLIDALNPWGFGHLLPRGLLREPPQALQRADLIVITRADQADETSISEIIENIRCFNSTCPICQVGFRPSGLRSATGQTAPLESVQAGPVAAFCGIGNPRAFWKTLDDLSAKVAWKREFPDHHNYTPRDLQELTRQVAESGISAVLTTLKDLVKFETAELAGRRLWAVDIQTHFFDGEDVLTERIRQIMSRATTAPVH